MAIIANTFLTYDAVGIREELENMIYRIDPTETPVLSMSKRGTAETTFPEWQEDSLEAAADDNYHIQGDDISAFDAVTPTERLGNRTQISRKTLVISETEEVVNKAGRKSEIAYQKAKRSAELKLDMEKTLCANQARVTGDSTTPSRMGSLLSFLQTNTVFQTGGTPSGADPVTKVSTARTDNSAVAAFTEQMLKDVMESCYTEGAKPKILLVGAHNKQVVSGFSGIAAHQINVAGAKPTHIVASADVYVSDFGNLQVRPSRLIRGRDALVLDPQYLEVLYLRPFKWVKLAKTGDAEKEFLRTEWTLKVGTEKAHGGVFDLASS